VVCGRGGEGEEKGEGQGGQEGTHHATRRPRPLRRHGAHRHEVELVGATAAVVSTRAVRVRAVCARRRAAASEALQRRRHIGRQSERRPARAQALKVGAHSALGCGHLLAHGRHARGQRRALLLDRVRARGLLVQLQAHALALGLRWARLCA
jgi:hypothetical protein